MWGMPCDDGGSAAMSQGPIPCQGRSREQAGSQDIGRECGPVDPSTLHFWPPELWHNTCLLFKPLVLGTLFQQA